MVIGINKAVKKNAILLYFKSFFRDHIKFEKTEYVGFFFFIYASTPFADSITEKVMLKQIRALTAYVSTRIAFIQRLGLKIQR